MAIGQDLLNVPMGDMIRQMAFAIADAQLELDESSAEVAELMSGRRAQRTEEGEPITDGTGNPIFDDTTVLFGGEQLSLLELGFTPVFYQFIDTIIEVKIAITITFEREFTRTVNTTSRRTTNRRRGFLFFGRRNRATVNTSQVNASYSSKYSYTAEGSSLLRTKLVPVPPPSILEERIRRLLEDADAASSPP